RFAIVVLTNNGLQVKVGENVAIQNYGALANQFFRILVSSCRSHWLRLNRVAQVDSEVGSIAQQLFNLIRLVGKRKRDVGDSRPSQRVDLIKEKRTVTDRTDRFGSVDGQRSKTGAFTASQNQCLH